MVIRVAISSPKCSPNNDNLKHTCNAVYPFENRFLQPGHYDKPSIYKTQKKRPEGRF